VSRPVALALAVTAAVCAACGVPSDASPHRVNPVSVPNRLLSTGNGTAAAHPEGPEAQVWFVEGEHLLRIRERVPGDNVPAGALRELLRGPSSALSSRGVRSAVPAGTRLISLDVSGVNATVDLTAAFGHVGGNDQVLAVAQIVYTLTAAEQISGVAFDIDGHPIEVPDGSGSLSAAPRGVADYPGLGQS
jgi:hypothetical protein